MHTFFDQKGFLCGLEWEVRFMDPPPQVITPLGSLAGNHGDM
jgi:hypothetical protein